MLRLESKRSLPSCVQYVTGNLERTRKAFRLHENQDFCIKFITLASGQMCSNMSGFSILSYHVNIHSGSAELVFFYESNIL